MSSYLNYMIPITAILMPVFIVLIVFWFKNERDMRRSEIIKSGIDKGYSIEDIKSLLDYKE